MACHTYYCFSTKKYRLFFTLLLDVEAEVNTNQWVERQRPQYHTTTTRSYSLRDPIVPDAWSHERQRAWLDIHSKFSGPLETMQLETVQIPDLSARQGHCIVFLTKVKSADKPSGPSGQSLH